MQYDWFLESGIVMFLLFLPSASMKNRRGSSCFLVSKTIWILKSENNKKIVNKEHQHKIKSEINKAETISVFLSFINSRNVHEKSDCECNSSK